MNQSHLHRVKQVNQRIQHRTGYQSQQILRFVFTFWTEAGHCCPIQNTQVFGTLTSMKIWYLTLSEMLTPSTSIEYFWRGYLYIHSLFNPRNVYKLIVKSWINRGALIWNSKAWPGTSTPWSTLQDYVNVRIENIKHTCVNHGMIPNPKLSNTVSNDIVFHIKQCVPVVISRTCSYLDQQLT